MVRQKLVIDLARILPGLLFVSVRAEAHETSGEVGLSAGLLHPITGPDHLLAMLGVGILSVILGQSRIWHLPLLFVFGMTLGVFAGLNEFTFMAMEIVIAMSLIVLGTMIASSRSPGSTLMALLTVFVFGLFHGNAHGLDIPSMAGPRFYVLGLFITTVFIHVLGIFIGEILSPRFWSLRLLRVLGLSGAFFGVFKLFVEISELA